MTPGRGQRAVRFRAVEQRVLDKYLPGSVEHHVPWSGGTVRVVEAGTGPTVVLLHGLTGTLTNLATLAGQLVQDNRCLLLDLPGHGLSGPLDRDGRPPRAVLVGALQAVLDALCTGGPAVLVGNSLGGMTALYLAADRPTGVAAVAVLGEPAYALRGARARMPLTLIGLPIVGRLVLGAPPPPLAVHRQTVRRAFGDRALDRVDPDVLDANRLSVWAGDHAASVAGLMRSLMGRGGRARAGVPLTARDIGGITVPVWFLWGAQDPFSSAEPRRAIVERFPDATHDVVEGGHLPWMDAPELTRRRLRDLIDRAAW